jgi:hypothetical protein
MTTKLFRDESIVFRIVNLPVDLLPDLEEAVAGHTLKTSPRKKPKQTEEKTKTVWFDIVSKYNYKRLLEFLDNNNISSKSYGIWISLVTERDNDGVHLPAYAVKFYKLIGGNLDFSFVSLRPDPDGSPD